MKAIIHLLPTFEMRKAAFLSSSNAGELAELFNKHGYTAMPPISVEDSTDGASIAEEMFDLTNNPNRQEEREQKYGHHRSVSSGDIVEVEGLGCWICLSIGWMKLK